MSTEASTETQPLSPPLPQPDELTQFFWDGLAEGELRIQRCQACGKYIHYPKPVCRFCQSTDLAGEPVSGRATLYSWTIAVQAFPTLLFDRKVDPVAFTDSLLDSAEASAMQPNDESALHEVLDMMSCKAAVKAGDAMSDEELAELLHRRDEIDRSSNCPHGRPTTVRLTLKDLEKHFKRT